MSWLSKKVDKARRSVDKVGKEFDRIDSGKGMPNFGTYMQKLTGISSREAFRYGVASMGGGMGLQYEYSRNKGMNSDQATKNATTGGYSYGDARAGQKADQAEVKQEEKDAEFARAQSAQEAADRNAQGVLIRRRRSRADPSKGGTLLTGSLGLAGSNAGTKLGVV